MFEYALIAALLAAAVYIFLFLRKNGFFATIEPFVTTTPKHLEQPLTVYYKYHLGAYSNAGNGIGDAKKILETSETVPTYFGIYYDDPKMVEAHFLQSAIGVIFGYGAKNLHDEKYAQALVDNGFEKMVLPKVERAVQASQPSTDGALSFLALVWFTYATMKKYISDNKLVTKYAVEFYTDEDITVVFPLDSLDEFLVKNYRPIWELESLAAKRKFDSSEDDSESEPDNEELDKWPEQQVE